MLNLAVRKVTARLYKVNMRKLSYLDVALSSGEFSLFDISPVKLVLHSHLSRHRICEADVGVFGGLDFVT
jgi:hypothetical protein